MYGCEAPAAIPVKGSGLPAFRCDRTSDGDALDSAKSPSRFADPAAASRNRCGVSQDRSAWASHPMISRQGSENGRYTRRCLHARRAEAIVRWFLTTNGLLLPFIALQMYVHGLIWIAALWAAIFPGATWSLAIVFRRAQTTNERSAI